ncbi:MAG: hypothetical protein ACJAT1_000105 [Marivirga sp.]|jgi:uncharacterized protein (TIGR02453 family)
MAYFTQDFIDFFKELTLNNTKDWFDENRKRYEKIVKEPFERFITDLVLAIQEFDPSIQIPPKKAIFRINRDIRFSNDKTPYKINRSAVLSRHNRKEQYPAYYLRIDANNIQIGGGVFNLSKDGLYKVREEIMYNEAQYLQAATGDKFNQFFPEMLGAKNKILKAPFKAAAEQTPILYNKQFYYMANYSNKVILEDNLIPFIVEKLATAYPVNKFLQFALEEE